MQGGNPALHLILAHRERTRASPWHHAPRKGPRDVSTSYPCMHTEWGSSGTPALYQWQQQFKLTGKGPRDALAL